MLLLFILILLLVALLLMPIRICIDTDNGLYYVECRGLVKVFAEADKEELFQVRVHTIFTDFYFYPLRLKSTKTTSKSKKSAGFRQGNFRLKTIWRMLKTFQIDCFFIRLDTGDPIMNAKLYPLFSFLNYRYGGFGLNFLGHNQLLIKISNRPIYILKSYINL